jgi:predicted amidohydrolase YtcJ
VLIQNAEVDGQVVDIRIGDDDETIDAAGGALIPGLHDHHLHLRALAAARQSVTLEPGDDLGIRLRDATGDWIRATGYHESIAGALDRWTLDRLVEDRPVRVQHRSGELWMLNSTAARAVGLPEDHDGRLWRQDDWLRDRIPRPPADLPATRQELARHGVTALTDTSPDMTSSDAAHLVDDALRQRLHLMLPPAVEAPEHPLVSAGPVKFLLDDTTLPPVDELAEQFTDARRAGRGIAVHCVTRVQLIATLAAGHEPGDRIEHGAVIPPELISELAELRVIVVTQPNFTVERADQYRNEVDPDDLDSLYRCRSLIDAGVRMLGGTDAPFGGADPWAAMRAAVHRDLGPSERVDPNTALSLFLGDGDGDHCLLHVPLEVALRELDASNVRATFVAGELIAGG